MKKKLLALVIAVIAIFALSVSASAEELHGWVENPDGTLSYYQYGNLYTDCFIYVAEKGNYRYVNEDGIMVENSWVFSNQEHTWSYFGKDGYSLYGWFDVDGVTYYFTDNHGEMATDCAVYDGEAYWAFDKSGNYYAINNTGWSFVAGNWHYITDKDYLVRGEVLDIDGTSYVFDYDANLASNEFVFCSFYDENGIYSDSRYAFAKADGTAVRNDWKWMPIEHDPNNGAWFYFDDKGAAVKGWQNIDGKRYFFLEFSGALQNTIIRDETGCYIFDENAYCYQCTEGWNFYDGAWYYIKEGRFAEGATKIDGDYYFFNGKLMADGLFYDGGDEYYAKADGKLAVNEWVNRYGSWYYYTENGAAKKSGFLEIDGKLYYFKYGYMQTDRVIYEDGKCYIVGYHDGVCQEATNGWIFDGADWFYAVDGDILTDGVYEIESGVFYAFDNYGHLYDYETTFDGQLVKNNGMVVTQEGWTTLNGSYAYVKSDATLANNEWLEIGGQNYYFEDFVLSSATLMLTDDDDYNLSLWKVNPDGTNTQLTADGWYALDAGFAYLRGGYAIRDEWLDWGGYRYYFGGDGRNVTGCTYDVFDPETYKYYSYYFDNNGHLRYGWILDE